MSKTITKDTINRLLKDVRQIMKHPLTDNNIYYIHDDTDILKGYALINPNLYKCGKVCVSILNTWSGDKWSACQTINSILLTLCSLLNSTPFLNEPGQHPNSRDYIAYNKSIEYCNINFVICDMINRDKNKIPEQFKIFYPFLKEHFYKNYEQILAFVDSKKDISEVLIVQMYSMQTLSDYNKLKTKLIETRQILDLDLDLALNNDLVKEEI